MLMPPASLTAWPAVRGIRLNDDSVAGLLLAAVQGPRWTWLRGYDEVDGFHREVAGSKQLTAAALTAAGLPPELAGDWDKVLSYISQLHASKAAGLAEPPCRGTLIVIGYQGAGKSSLVWRLRHPDTGEVMPELDSTDGIATGRRRRASAGVHVAYDLFSSLSRFYRFVGVGDTSCKHNFCEAWAKLGDATNSGPWRARDVLCHTPLLLLTPSRLPVVLEWARHGRRR